MKAGGPKLGRVPRKQLVAEVFGGAFYVPARLGYGEHWALEESEGRDLAERLLQWLESLPKKKTARTLELLDTWAPLGSFIVMVAVLVGTKIMLTREYLKRAVVPEVGTRETPPSTVSSTDAAAHNGTAHHEGVTTKRSAAHAALGRLSATRRGSRS